MQMIHTFRQTDQDGTVNEIAMLPILGFAINKKLLFDKILGVCLADVIIWYRKGGEQLCSLENNMVSWRRMLAALFSLLDALDHSWPGLSNLLP